jgi:hypothetical protein
MFMKAFDGSLHRLKKVTTETLALTIVPANRFV